MRTNSSRQAHTLRSMPSWLMLAPWLVVACSLLLAVLVLVLDFRGGKREMQITTRIYLERGSALIHAFEATVQAGMGFQWTDEELQGVLDKLGTNPEIHYMAVTDESGHVLAASRASMVGTTLLDPEELEELKPSQRIKGRLVTFMADNSAPTRVFQVYQLLSARQYGERLRQHGHMRHGRMMNSADMPCALNSASTSEQRFIVFIGYDMSAMLEAQRMDARQAFVHWSVLAFLAVVGLLTLFLVKGYQRSRRLVQETTAFSFALIDTLPLGIIAMDALGRITTFNPEAARITGLKGSEALGEDMAVTLPGLWSVLNEAGLLNEQAPNEQEVRCVFGPQRRIPLSLTASPVITEDGRHVGHALILRDLGEIRRLQAEIRRQDRLAALGNMAAGIAHEIRNPLGAIKGLARFFGEISPANSEEARMADIMTQEVLRLDNVVGDLLELARPDKLNLTPTSPATLLDRVSQLVRSDMDAQGIRYEQRVPEDLPDVPLDADRMSQVLLNLFLNAVQAMPQGGELTAGARLMSASGREDGEAGSFLVLEVEDTGTGIPKDKMQEIFSPYYTTKARGTGLGLSLVHKIVEAHDGEIDVQSTPGRGTRFTLTLPLPVRPMENHHV